MRTALAMALAELRFAGGYGHEFHSAEGVNGEGDGQERGGWSEGKESAVGGVLRSGASGEEQCGAEHDEGGDDGDLDHGEPEFEAPVGVDAEQISREQEAGKSSDPDDGGHAWKPEVHVGGGGDHLGADGDGDGEPVSGAGDESGPLVEVEVSVDAEGTGGGMSAGEFAEGQGDGPADEGGEDKAEDDGGPGELNGGGGAEEESGADGAADGDHGHLSGGELVAKAGLWVRGT